MSTYLYQPTTWSTPSRPPVRTLSARKDEVNRLNVFPVPDGDTGTNMSLTLESVVDNLAKLPIGASAAEIRQGHHHRRAHGRARELRRHHLADPARSVRRLQTASTRSAPSPSSAALAKAQDVAFHAVRKPVEGTILTVLKDIRCRRQACPQEEDVGR